MLRSLAAFSGHLALVSSMDKRHGQLWHGDICSCMLHTYQFKVFTYWTYQFRLESEKNVYHHCYYYLIITFLVMVKQNRSSLLVSLTLHTKKCNEWQGNCFHPIPFSQLCKTGPWFCLFRMLKKRFLEMCVYSAVRQPPSDFFTA